MSILSGISRRSWHIVLVGLLVFGLALRLHGVLILKQGYSHDESVSYLCASATEAAYQEDINGLLDRPITAGTIQGYYGRPAHLELGKVAKDLAHWDIHPPLYFWALHCVHVILGAGLVGGALLNVLAGLLILILLFAIAKRALGSTTAALVTTVVWYLSPAVVQIDLEARQYQFLALFAMASFLIGDRLSDGRRAPGLLVLFTLVNASGMLSHYYFSFLLVPGVCIMLLRQGIRAPTLLYVGSLLLSLCLFILAFPSIFDFVDVFLQREPDPDAAERSFLDRIRTFVYASLAFFTYGHWSRYIYLLVVSLVLFIGAVRIRPDRAALRTLLWTPLGQITIFLVWAVAFTVLFYMVGISPAQAAGEQYFSYIWPPLAIVLVYLVRKVLPTRSLGRVASLHIVLLAMAFSASIRNSAYVQRVLPSNWYAALSDSDLMITDERKRSGLPRICRDLRADLPLFILNEQRPDLSGISKVAFLHLELKGRNTIAPLLQWMDDQGFRHEMAQHGHYQLHSYSR